MRRSIAVASAFALGCGIVASATVAAFLLPRPAGVLAAAEPETTYPVTLNEHADRRPVALVPTFTEGFALTAHAGGMVTASACVPGGALASGEIALVLDAAPVVALAAPRPFHRDLAFGDEGDDVVALRGALNALGAELPADGAFDGDVADALRELQDRTGTTSDDGVFRLRDILWLPRDGVRLASCDARLGQAFGPGSTFAVTERTLASLAVASEAREQREQPVPGERTLTLLGVEVVLPADGVIDDPDEVAAIAANPQFAAIAAGAPGSGGTQPAIPAQSQLVQPVHVAAVPPSSVFALDGARGCVSSDDAAHPVTVVGSNLGMSLVAFEGDAPASVLIDGDIAEAEGCRDGDAAD
ncbi:peptidoglycan-binding protein [Microbacterium sp. No. 7]|uniref:peptidoglycan-binding protein n=1 Tax=Microbacterium sp. No. 7 TaxID=1714373 RepID=UPI0006D144CE|nr:peptidoglycan-binding protein [Microbacterium sp. No. 7]ALJ21515.1 hypothetical protein AOA12_17100 [Microbacterium sp. No. 7]